MADDFVIRIRADDTAAVAAIKRLQAALGKVTEPVEKAQKRFARLGATGQDGLEKLKKGFRGVENGARNVVDKITQIVPGLTAITGAASLAGLSALAVKFGTFGFSLNKSSKLLGMNAQDLAAWHVAARRAGVSAQEFDSSISGSQMAIRGAAFGANPEAMMYLQKMGVQITRNRDGSIDYLKTQQQILQALARQKNAQAQRAAAGALGMGALLPMIQQGTWQADRISAIKKGLVPTPEEIERARQFHLDISDLENSVSGLGNSIGSTLIPILDPLVRGFAKWLDANRAQIARAIGDAVEKFAKWMQSIDWDSVATKAGKFYDAIGGMKGVLIAIAAITFAGPISGALTLASALGKIGGAALGLQAGGALGILGRLGLYGGAVAGGLKLAEMAGLPNVDASKGIEDVRKGRWGAASAHLSAPDFIKAAWRHAAGFGKSDSEIADELQAHHSSQEKPDSPIAGAISAALAAHAGKAAVAAAVESQQKYGVPASVTLAQYGLESSYGAHMPTGSNNPFGIKARPGQPYVEAQTDEFINGKMERVTQRFAKFDSLSDAFDAHAKLLATGRAYASARKHADDPMAYADALTGHYATDPHYGEKLQTIMAGGGAGSQSSSVQHHISVDFKNVPPGTSVSSKSSDGGYLPTRVNYAMSTDYGAIP